MEDFRKIILLMTIFSFMSVGWGQDNNPPELTYFSFSPDTVNLNNRNPVEFIIEGIDDISGFDLIEIGVHTEDGNNYKWTGNYNLSGETEVSDTLYITFEENDPEGIWYVNYIYMRDVTGNYDQFQTYQLEEMGFPTEIFVTYGESPCVLLGDVNNDSILNVQDIVLIINLILDGEYDECGDVNSDGTINVQDVVIFVNIILSGP